MLRQKNTEDAMGEGRKEDLRVTFDGRLKLEFHSFKVTSDAGLLHACWSLESGLGTAKQACQVCRMWQHDRQFN